MPFAGFWADSLSWKCGEESVLLKRTKKEGSVAVALGAGHERVSCAK